MYIFELIKPGTFLEGIEQEDMRVLSSMLVHIESTFYEANVALNLFEREQSKDHLNFEYEQNPSKWLKESQRRHEIEKDLASKSGDNFAMDYEGIRFQAEIYFKREKWNVGETPNSLKNKIIFIYAKAFLYAFDMLNKFIRKMSILPQCPECVSAISEMVDNRFPHLTGVRNTNQHLEDRARGIGKYEKKLQLKSVNNGFIKADGGALILNNLNGNCYGSTMSDGTYGEIEISPESMDVMRDIVQKVFNSFQWSGPREHLPR